VFVLDDAQSLNVPASGAISSATASYGNPQFDALTCVKRSLAPDAQPIGQAIPPQLRSRLANPPTGFHRPVQLGASPNS
jgi:hypothetical protein